MDLGSFLRRNTDSVSSTWPYEAQRSVLETKPVDRLTDVILRGSFDAMPRAELLRIDTEFAGQHVEHEHADAVRSFRVRGEDWLLFHDDRRPFAGHAVIWSDHIVLRYLCVMAHLSAAISSAPLII